MAENSKPNRKPGIGKRGNVERNAKVFHVVQRTMMKLPLLESDHVFDYWQHHFRICCIEENISILCFTVMTNHIHTILYTEEYRSIGRAFRRLNTGLSQFISNKIIKDSEYAKLFPEAEEFRLFSSSPRLFPIEGTIPLFIDTRYLFDNPKHHGASNTGLYYRHSNFMTLYKGEYERKDLRLFYDLYNMYPGQVMKTISKGQKEFIEALTEISRNLDRHKENLVFKVNPDKDWTSSAENVRDGYKLFDIQ